MSALYRQFWPKGLPASIQAPASTLHYNLEAAAHRFPDKPAIVFFDSITIYAQLKRNADAIAGYLHERYGIANGDRV